jgi:hypothetical protein
METLKDVWYAVIDEDKDKPISVFQNELDARYEAGQIDKVPTRVERVGITINRIKTT